MEIEAEEADAHGPSSDLRFPEDFKGSGGFQDCGNLFGTVGFDPIAGLEFVEIFDTDPAFQARFDFAHVFLEAAQGGCFSLEQDLVLPEHPDQGVSRESATGNNRRL